MATTMLMQASTAAAVAAAASSSENSKRGSSLQRLSSAACFPSKLSVSLQKRSAKRNAQFVVRASATGDDHRTTSLAPMKLESPVGQFLVTILQSHPHLFNAAAEQQLELLAAEKEAARDTKPTTGSELVLYKRIAEVKQQERHMAIVELMYTMVVQKFLSLGVGLIPELPKLAPDQRVDNWPQMEKELESIHSPEVLEVVRGRLSSIVPQMNNHMDQHMLVQVSRLRIGHLYAVNAMVGYFLRRLDQRYRLEEGIKSLSSSSDDKTKNAVAAVADEKSIAGVSEDMDFTADAEGQKLAAELHAIASARSSFTLPQWKSGKLKSYAMSLDPDVFQKLTVMRSKESIELVERQTQALFGKPKVEQSADGNLVVPDDMFTISWAGFKRLFLESIAFGSFLWEAESSMEDTLV